MRRTRGGYTQHLGLSVFTNTRRRREISDLSAGYTIIEVLIVLAVGVIIFFAAVTMFAGKQGKTQFSQAMRDVQSEVQSIVNDVGVSLFPNADQYSCSISGGRPVLTSVASGTGTNEDCIFLGKAIKIDTSADPNKLITYTVLGSRISAGNIVTSITESNFLNASPEPFTVVPAAPAPDLSETYNIPSGVTVVSARSDRDSGPSTQTYMVGFYNGQQSSTDQGSLSLLPLGYVGTRGSTAPGLVKSSIENNTPNAGVAIKKWTICFQSGTSNEMAKLIINASAAGISSSVVYGTCT